MSFKDNVNDYINSQNITYVSFDLYDTLIFRALYKPDDVWALLHKRYVNSNKKCNKDIKGIRIQGEIAARRKAKSEDVTIDDIYAEMDLDLAAKEDLKQIERDIEVEISMPNKPMISMLNGLKNKGICILITTDMYLDERTIKAILNKNGIIFDYLYISGKAGVRKETGNLFTYIIEELGISPQNIIHIGDNKHSDVDIPKSKGINSFYYLNEAADFEQYLLKTQCGYLFKKNNIKNRIINKIKKCLEKEYILYDDIYSNYFVSYLNAVYKSEMSDNIRLGYCILGPVMTALCNWIHEEKKKENIDQLWFVAREGFLIKNAYLTLYPDEGTSVKYVRYNKNICRLPFMLSVHSSDDLAALLPSIRSFTIDVLLKLFLVDNKEEVLEKIKEKTGYTNSSVIKMNDLAVGGGILKIIFDSVSDKAKVQYEMMIESLKEQLGQTVGKRPKIALVNNSINGSIQYMLERIISERQELDIDFYGLQIVDNDICKRRSIKYAAWLKEINNPYYIRFFHRTLNIFERLLFENCGTALNLSKKDEKIQVVCEVRKAELNNDSVLLPVQDMAIQFVKIAEKFRFFDITQDALAIYFQMMSYPLIEDAGLIGNLAFDEVNEEGKLIHKKENLGFLKLLLKARKEVWPNGFLVLNKAPKILQDIFVWRYKIKDWF